LFLKKSSKFKRTEKQSRSKGCKEGARGLGVKEERTINKFKGPEKFQNILNDHSKVSPQI
jgi:hypothetical protein